MNLRQLHVSHGHGMPGSCSQQYEAGLDGVQTTLQQIELFQRIQRHICYICWCTPTL